MVDPVSPYILKRLVTLEVFHIPFQLPKSSWGWIPPFPYHFIMRYPRCAARFNTLLRAFEYGSLYPACIVSSVNRKYTTVFIKRQTPQGWGWGGDCDLLRRVVRAPRAYCTPTGSFRITQAMVSEDDAIWCAWGSGFRGWKPLEDRDGIFGCELNLTHRRISLSS